MNIYNNTTLQLHTINISLDKPIIMACTTGILYSLSITSLPSSLIIGTAATIATSCFLGDDNDNKTLVFDKEVTITNPTIINILKFSLNKIAKA